MQHNQRSGAQRDAIKREGRQAGPKSADTRLGSSGRRNLRQAVSRRGSQAELYTARCRSLDRRKEWKMEAWGSAFDEIRDTTTMMESGVPAADVALVRSSALSVRG